MSSVALRKHTPQKFQERRSKFSASLTQRTRSTQKRENANMVQASGIPELRQYCHNVTADAQLLEAKHYLQSRLASFISSIEIWSRSSMDNLTKDHGDTQNLLRETLQQAENQVDHAPCMCYVPY